MIILTPRRGFKVPVDAGNITPDSFNGKTIVEIKALPVWEGNRRKTLDDLFKNDYKDGGLGEEATILIVGDLTKVKRIGAEMSFGRIIIEGSVGMRLGEGMRGGSITVKGNVDSWAGTMMRGGKIEIFGNVGDYVGSAYRGSTLGMRRGTIIIHGSAGSEVGCFMRGGLIKVRGDVGLFAGVHMRDGTILVEGDSDGRLGAGMVGGRIVLLGSTPYILPSFTFERIRKSVKLGNERVSGPFYVFLGDLADKGEGRIYISQWRNPHLKSYERYLT